ncbi:hypothetical protein BHE74_00013706 [Ensete ventricosum]|nr:hypothetical protein BHE74_00013706 [Ensete ventricosum]
MRQAIAREVLSVDNEEGRDCVAAIADGGRCNGRRGRRGSGQVVNWKERLVGHRIVERKIERERRQCPPCGCDRGSLPPERGCCDRESGRGRERESEKVEVARKKKKKAGWALDHQGDHGGATSLGRCLPKRHSSENARMMCDMAHDDLVATSSLPRITGPSTWSTRREKLIGSRYGGANGRAVDLAQVRPNSQRSYGRPETGKADTLTCGRMPHRKDDDRGGGVRRHDKII